MFLRFPISDLKDRPNISLPNFLISNSFVCGGYIRQLICGSPHNTDIDLFFRSQQDLESQEKFLLDFGFRYSWGNDTVKCYKRDSEIVQLIFIAFFPTIEQHLQEFDFTICQFGYDCSTQEIVIASSAVVDTLRKKLVVNKITYPVASMRRMLKYNGYGFTPCNGTLMSMAQSCKSADINMEIKYID